MEPLETNRGRDGLLPDRHDPRPGACADAFLTARPGDLVRLYGFSGDHWLEGRVRVRRADGLLEMSLLQCVDGSVAPLGVALVRLDDGGATFVTDERHPSPADAFGHEMGEYRAQKWGGERSSDGFRAWPCEELPETPVRPGDALRLSGYAPDNWLDAEILSADGRGVRVRARQVVAGRPYDLGQFDATLDAAGLTALPPLVADAFGRPLDSYRAPFFSLLPAAARREIPAPREDATPACALVALDVVERVVRLESFSTDRDSRLSSLGAAIERLAEASRATDGSVNELSQDVRALTRAVSALVENRQASPAVLAEPQVPAPSASVAVAAREMTVTRTTVTAGAPAERVVEAAPDRSPDIAHEISHLLLKSGGKFTWGKTEVVLLRLAQNTFSVKPPKPGPDTYTPKADGPWTSQATAKKLWDLWVADGGDAFDATVWESVRENLAAAVDVFNQRAAQRVPKVDVLLTDLDRDIAKSGEITRASRRVRAGEKPGTYLVHVDALEHDVRAVFLEEIRKDLEKSKASVITRNGIGIRLVDDVWLVRAKKSKEWLPATEAHLWSLFSAGLLWEKWDRALFGRFVLRTRKEAHHADAVAEESAIAVPEAVLADRVVETSSATPATVTSESVTVRSAVAEVVVEGQGAAHVAEAALEATAADIPLLGLRPDEPRA